MLELLLNWHLPTTHNGETVIDLVYWKIVIHVIQFRVFVEVNISDSGTSLNVDLWRADIIYPFVTPH